MTPEERRELVAQQKQKVKDLTKQLKEEEKYLTELNVPSEEDQKRFSQLLNA